MGVCHLHDCISIQILTLFQTQKRKHQYEVLVLSKEHCFQLVSFPGCSALHVAARAGHSDCIARVLCHKVHVGSQDGRKMTALHHAGMYLSRMRWDMVRIVLQGCRVIRDACQMALYHVGMNLLEGGRVRWGTVIVSCKGTVSTSNELLLSDSTKPCWYESLEGGGGEGMVKCDTVIVL